ncbi:antA/AntB antirepressor family protein [Asaia bogorensis]|uniref:antA/AntB antirepressor family protein n=1 Tax=Asaia bogorensis TaxID=91915 RepID=UPI000EFB089B|nr:antA/AntB antirepressor family protein [Asaia bogorensis]
MNANLPVPAEFSAIATICVATESTIGGRKCLTVDGRALHAGLKVGRAFGAWLPARIESHGFQEDSDYQILLSNSGKQNGSGGHNLKNYSLTIDMAKQLAMIENNEMGRLARRYFLWVEQAAISAALPLGAGQHGGITKAVITRALLPVTARMDAQEARLATLVERLETAITAYDPSAGFTTDYRPMRFFVENAGVLQKGRGGLIRNMSRRCVNWLLRNDLGGSIRHSRDQERHLFHVDAVPRWMQFEGAEMIRAHMDKMTGQGTFAPKGKKGRTELSPRPFSRPKEAAS